MADVPLDTSVPDDAADQREQTPPANSGFLDSDGPTAGLGMGLLEREEPVEADNEDEVDSGIALVENTLQPMEEDRSGSLTSSCSIHDAFMSDHFSYISVEEDDTEWLDFFGRGSRGMQSVVTASEAEALPEAEAISVHEDNDEVSSSQRPTAATVPDTTSSEPEAGDREQLDGRSKVEAFASDSPAAPSASVSIEPATNVKTPEMSEPPSKPPLLQGASPASQSGRSGFGSKPFLPSRLSRLGETVKKAGCKLGLNFRKKNTDAGLGPRSHVAEEHPGTASSLTDGRKASRELMISAAARKGSTGTRASAAAVRRQSLRVKESAALSKASSKMTILSAIKKAPSKTMTADVNRERIAGAVVRKMSSGTLALVAGMKTSNKMTVEKISPRLIALMATNKISPRMMALAAARQVSMRQMAEAARASSTTAVTRNVSSRTFTGPTRSASEGDLPLAAAEEEEHVEKDADKSYLESLEDDGSLGNSEVSLMYDPGPPMGYPMFLDSDTHEQSYAEYLAEFNQDNYERPIVISESVSSFSVDESFKEAVIEEKKEPKLRKAARRVKTMSKRLGTRGLRTLAKYGMNLPAMGRYGHRLWVRSYIKARFAGRRGLEKMIEMKEYLAEFNQDNYERSTLASESVTSFPVDESFREAVIEEKEEPKLRKAARRVKTMSKRLGTMGLRTLAKYGINLPAMGRYGHRLWVRSYLKACFAGRRGLEKMIEMKERKYWKQQLVFVKAIRCVRVPERKFMPMRCVLPKRSDRPVSQFSHTTLAYDYEEDKFQSRTLSTCNIPDMEGLDLPYGSIFGRGAGSSSYDDPNEDDDDDDDEELTSRSMWLATASREDWSDESDEGSQVSGEDTIVRQRQNALMEHPFFMLEVRLQEGKDLVIRDSCDIQDRTSDPYVKFKIGGKQVYRSKTIYKNLNPKWDETFTIPVEDVNKPVNIKVFDYDRGLHDDPMGNTEIDVSQLELGKSTELKLLLSDRGKPDYMGYLLLTCTLQPKTQEDKDQFLRRTTVRPTDAVSKKMKMQSWSGVVTIVLVEGQDLVPMDDNGLSDPYVKFRLGNEKCRSKHKSKTLSPKWLEQFDLRQFQDLASQLEITVFDYDVTGKDDFMGRAMIDLSTLELEITHHLDVELEDGAGMLKLLLTISGQYNSDAQSDLCNYTPDSRTQEQLMKKYSALKLSDITDVGTLQVKVFKAIGLKSADLGGQSDPFCVLELVNARVQTHTEYKTLNPEWNKVFTFKVRDIHSVLEVTIFDEDRDKKVEFLGKVAIPLLRIKNGERRWYALKERKLVRRAKGAILLEMDLVFNNVKAAVRTVNPAEEKFMQVEPKFKIHLMKRNIDRVSQLINTFVEGGKFVQSCFNWESTPRSATAFIVFLVMVWNFELYMLPITLLLIFLKNLIIAQIVGAFKREQVEDEYFDEEDEEEDEEKEKFLAIFNPVNNAVVQEEKKSFKEKLQSIQDVCLQVQQGMDMVASLGERVKNTFNWSVPWLSTLAVVALSVGVLVLYFIPIRLLILAWGINKFTKKLRKPNAISNNELLDFLSRVPSDSELQQYREMRPEFSPTPGKKKRS